MEPTSGPRVLRRTSILSDREKSAFSEVKTRFREAQGEDFRILPQHLVYVIF